MSIIKIYSGSFSWFFFSYFAGALGRHVPKCLLFWLLEKNKWLMCCNSSRMRNSLLPLTSDFDAIGTKTYWFVNFLNFAELIFTSAFLSRKQDNHSEAESKLLSVELGWRIFILMMRVYYCYPRRHGRNHMLILSRILTMFEPLIHLTTYLSCWSGSFDNPYDWIILFNWSFSGTTWLAFLLLCILWCPCFNQQQGHQVIQQGGGDNNIVATELLPVTINPERKIEVVRNLPEYPYNKIPLDEERRQCVICLSEFSLGETIKLLPCTHMFHSKCIERWLNEYKMNCPSCRFSLGEPLDSIRPYPSSLPSFPGRQPHEIV